MGDILFSSIEKMNAMRCWGRFLDAGTGVHSLKWIQKLPTTEWVAITADNNMKAQITNDKDIKMRLPHEPFPGAHRIRTVIAIHILPFCDTYTYTLSQQIERQAGCWKLDGRIILQEVCPPYLRGHA